ncbi:MAG: hypothetical protein LC772_12780, partial [Chloroflexi bacterium]|nr:hypothetical protein [Chloroflexota bacterium]
MTNKPLTGTPCGTLAWHNTLRAGVPRRSWLIAAAVLMVLASGLPPARAQESSAFVYVTDVQVTQLSNAVRLTIEADGTIDLDQGNDLIFQFVTATPELRITPVRQMRLRLLNCRSRLGSFKDVGLFPVDHVEFAVPQDSSNGVGLDVTISFDEPVLPGKIMDEFDSGGTTRPTVSVIASADRRGIIVTVTSDLFPEHKVVRKSVSSPGVQSLAVSTLPNGDVDVEAVNEPLSAVLRKISQVTGLSLGIDAGSERLISAVLRQSPSEVITSLAGAYGLALS